MAIGRSALFGKVYDEVGVHNCYRFVLHCFHVFVRHHGGVGRRDHRRGEVEQSLPAAGVKRRLAQAVVTGINTQSENSQEWYIADNEIVGINETWYPRPEAYMSPAHTGVNVYDRGHTSVSVTDAR